MSFPAWARASLIAAAMSLAACSEGNRAAMTMADTDVVPLPVAAEARADQPRGIPAAMPELADFTALVDRFGVTGLEDRQVAAHFSDRPPNCRAFSHILGLGENPYSIGMRALAREIV